MRPRRLGSRLDFMILLLTNADWKNLFKIETMSRQWTVETPHDVLADARHSGGASVRCTTGAFNQFPWKQGKICTACDSTPT